jgi:hypothetical protein
MRRQSVSIFTTLSKEELEAIINIVSETMAAGEPAIKEKKISAADLWNIQRQKRTFVQRRSSF